MKQGTNKKVSKENSRRVAGRGVREYIERHNWWTWVGQGESLAWMKPRLIHALALLTLLLSFFMMGISAKADLSVTVTPGYQLSPGEIPTVDTLNELGIPTIVITGTLGSNSLSPASISGIALVDTFPDGGVLGLPSGLKTIGWNVANPRQISVDCTNLCDGNSAIQGNDVDTLQVFADPGFFAISTNSMGVGGNTNVNTGSGTIKWLTIQAGTLYDAVIAPGGISSVSITNAGLNAWSINSKQIFTNVFTIPGGFWTNTVTNFNTAVVGNSNGLAIPAQLGPGLVLSNVPTVYTTNISGTLYTVTQPVPTLEFLGFNGNLPLEVNMGPWSNVVGFAASPASTNWIGTNSPVLAYPFGGLPNYTNFWTWGFVGVGANMAFSGFVTNEFGNGTNSSSVIFIGTFNFNGTGVTGTLSITDTVYDVTGQKAVTTGFIGFHHL